MIIIIIQFSNSITSGTAGEDMGYGPNFPNSMAVEFDTFQNTDVGDPAGAHVGIDLQGSVTSKTYSQIGFTNGALWYAWVDYVGGGTQILQVRVSSTATKPVNPTLQWPVNLHSIIGSSNLYVGFGGSTGSAYQTTTIDLWQFSEIAATDLQSGLAGKFYNIGVRMKKDLASPYFASVFQLSLSFLHISQVAALLTSPCPLVLPCWRSLGIH